MGKRSLRTPRSRVRQALRQLWLRSRERASALKRDGYTCQECKRKQSKAKGQEFSVEVHHKDRIVAWDKIIDLICEEILCEPEKLQTLCPDCHDKEEQKGRMTFP